MAFPPSPRHRGDFEVAIICALSLEAEAVEALFDKYWDEDGDPYGKSSGDPNAYTTGMIGRHNVVLAYMPGTGKGNAASVAASLRSSFGGIKLALVVGVCGAAPNGNNGPIFLGDIIISDGIVEYDLGSQSPNTFVRKDTLLDNRGRPNNEIRAFLNKLKGRRGRARLKASTRQHLEFLRTKFGHYHPTTMHDTLFDPAYQHKHHNQQSCRECSKDQVCQAAREATCDTLHCDKRRILPRRRQPDVKKVGDISGPEHVEVHIGLIVSGDIVMRSGKHRDEVAAREQTIAFEMEGAGVCDNLPCVVIKGVSDYADSHKNDSWQGYAALTAASCMKAFLELWTVTDPILAANFHSGATDLQVKRTICGQANITDQETNLSISGPDWHSRRTKMSFRNHRPHRGENETLPRFTSRFPNPTEFKVIPEVMATFKNVASLLKRIRKSLPHKIDLRTPLKAQRASFETEVTILLSYISDSPELANDMIQETSNGLWQAESVHMRLEAFLGTSGELCLQIIKDIHGKLRKIESLTRRLKSEASKERTTRMTSAASDASNQDSLQHELKLAVEELKSNVQDFSTIIPHAWRKLRDATEQYATISRRDRQVVEKFRPIQTAACSLYRALGNACNMHENHKVQLSLQPCINTASTQVKFSAAFSTPSTGSLRQKRHIVQITVESLLSQTATSSREGQCSSEELILSRKRQRPTDQAQPVVRARNNVQSEIAPKEIIQTSNSIPHNSLPNICVQRNFCSVIQRHLEQQVMGFNACIGLLEDKGTYKHLVYVEHLPNGACTPTSLSELMTWSKKNFEKSLGLFERIQLAKHLATAVLYFHATPWLDEAWRSKDVHLFQNANRPPQYPQLPLPYISTLVRGQTFPGGFKGSSSGDHYIIRNRTLFSLGVIFLELAFEAPLKSLQNPTDLQQGESEVLTEYFTALRLSKRISSRVCKSYQEVVEKCLQCDFGCGNDFNNISLQEAFYRSVIGELDRLERLFEELQLDDRKLSTDRAEAVVPVPIYDGRI